jgi:hypothetical protein
MFSCLYATTFFCVPRVLAFSYLTGELDTFIVYNERKKVTSSAKRKLKPDDRSLHQVNISDFAVQ